MDSRRRGRHAGVGGAAVCGARPERDVRLQPVGGDALPEHRALPRRPRDHGDGRGLETRTFYMGSTGGGVWKTTDAGATWDNVSDGLLRRGVDGRAGRRQLESQRRLRGHRLVEDPQQRLGGQGHVQVHRCRPTWSFVGLEKTSQISTIRVDPTNPDIVYVAALGNPFVNNVDRGVFKTVDGGGRGRRCSTLATAWAQPISNCSRATRTSCSPPSGAGSASRGRSSAGPPPAASTRAPTAATTGPSSAAACPPGCSAAPTSRSPTRIRTASTPTSRPSRAGASTGRRTPVRRGRSSTATRSCGRVRSTTTRSPSTRPMPTWCTWATRTGSRARTAARPSTPSARRTATTTTCGSIRPTRIS